ncbi:hypothetical protein ES705_10431 [subsurface metagenome]
MMSGACLPQAGFHLTLNTGMIKILPYHYLSDGKIRQNSNYSNAVNPIGNKKNQGVNPDFFHPKN